MALMTSAKDKRKTFPLSRESKRTVCPDCGTEVEFVKVGEDLKVYVRCPKCDRVMQSVSCSKVPR